MIYYLFITINAGHWIWAISRYCLVFFFNFYCYSITVVCLFSPSLHPTPADPTALPHPPPWFCPCVLYSSSCNSLSSLPPPHSPLTIVRLFLTSMSLVIFCFLLSSVDYVPVKGEIIWYLDRVLNHLTGRSSESHQIALIFSFVDFFPWGNWGPER